MSLHIFILIIATIGLLFASCDHGISESNVYPQDLALSKPNGEPIDSFTLYFPDSVKRDTTNIETRIGRFSDYISILALYSAQEPVLYNFYLGHDIYRFIWLRSLNPPLLFSLHKDGIKVWLTTKKLDHALNYPVKSVIPFKGPGDTIVTESEKAELDRQRDSINQALTTVSIVLNETKNLSVNEWNKFEQLLKESRYWEMFSNEHFGLDGSDWIIEAHLQDKYWVVGEWSPKGNFRKCGEYLIDLSGVKEVRY